MKYIHRELSNLIGQFERTMVQYNIYNNIYTKMWNYCGTMYYKKQLDVITRFFVSTSGSN